MATELSKFLPYVLPYVPGCPIPMAEQALRVAIADFCHSTMLIQNIDVLDVTEDQSDYDIGEPSGMVLSRVLSVMVGDRTLVPTTLETVRAAPALAGAAVGPAVLPSGPPTHFFQRDLSAPSITMYPVPDTTIIGGAVIRSAFAPKPDTTTYPDILYRYWVKEISYGALASLYGAPGQPFYNAPEAVKAEAMFAYGVRSASIDARSGLVAASSRVQQRRFA